MRNVSRNLITGALVLLTLVGWAPVSHSQDSSQAPGRILKLFSVGGVLTADGKLWQFRPDRDRWMTIDEAFRDQGQETSILPLPVPPEAIREMVTFGFLLTDTGECWLYDLEQDKWRKLPPPR